MNLSDDEKLEIFLKENRPLHPRHSEREAEKIWVRIQSQEKKPTAWLEWIFGASASVTVAIAFFFLNPSLQNQPATATDEIAMVDESLDLGFLEHGELYEVSDLLAISK